MSQYPPPPSGGPPPGQWGMPPPQTPRPRGVSPWGQVGLGALIGMIAGPIVLLLVLFVIGAVAAENYDNDITGELVFALCVLVPTLLPVPLLFFRATRMWAVGVIIGAGLSTIALAGACALIITGLSGGTA
ncbi:MAG: hypothetical protein Q8O61_00570 [Nocardioides sp.]|nr:hypothetical protein [Nocardioides sp.]